MDVIPSYYLVAPNIVVFFFVFLEVASGGLVVFLTSRGIMDLSSSFHAPPTIYEQLLLLFFPTYLLIHDLNDNKVIGVSCGIVTSEVRQQQCQMRAGLGLGLTQV